MTYWNKSKIIITRFRHLWGKIKKKKYMLMVCITGVCYTGIKYSKWVEKGWMNPGVLAQLKLRPRYESLDAARVCQEMATVDEPVGGSTGDKRNY